ncbi:glycoside hydrolase family 78 protein [Flavobacterium aquidurense]|uniref:glycoside hydrolase family 78 protein n=1 Tax=Flavobacterium aquidurense TaxID=362413 RepID=UPI00371AB062
MKNFIYLSIIGFLFAACGGGGGDDSDPVVVPPIVNIAPTVPALTAPADGKLCLDKIIAFQWALSTDENKDNITYQIQIAKDNSFSQIVKTLEVTTNSTSAELEKNTAYYWRVKATDSKGLSSNYTATYKFYTTGDAVVNHLPFSPELVQPSINSVSNTTTATLKWTATDVDTKDVLTYDVYFGKTNPPTAKVSENTSAISFDVTLEPTTQYFWQIVVKDNKGGETVGQVWKFKTN